MPEIERSLLTTLCEGSGGWYVVAFLMTPKTVTLWAHALLFMGNGSRSESVGGWEAFTDVAYRWGVGSLRRIQRKSNPDRISVTQPSSPNQPRNHDLVTIYTINQNLYFNKGITTR